MFYAKKNRGFEYNGVAMRMLCYPHIEEAKGAFNLKNLF